MQAILDKTLWIGLLAATIRMTTPLLYASLGELFAERSGVLNLGVEGMMLIGAFTGFLGAYYTGNPWVGVLTGIIGGALVALVMAFMSVSLGVNQVLTAVMIILASGGLVTFLNQKILGGSYIPPSTEGFQPLAIPLLSQIPVLGPILFRQNILVYLAFLFVPILSVVMYRTTIGLKIRAVGENPRAADALGVSVYATRYLCVLFGGMMAGLAGSFLTLGYINTFNDGITGGRGWIAVALVIFGNWDPVRVMFGALLFGGIDALQLRIQAIGIEIPHEFVLMLPYVLTLLALIVVARKSESPRMMGTAYDREQK